MLEKIQQNCSQRKQKGKLKLKKRVNITYPYFKNTFAIFTNKPISLKFELFKRIKLDLTKILSPYFNIIYTVTPNKPITNKGILVRMGKGKGKIKTFGTRVSQGTICIFLVPLKSNPSGFDGTNFLSSFFRKYPFFSLKKYFSG